MSGRDTIVSVISKLLRAIELQVEAAEDAWTALRTYQAGPAGFADYLIGLRGRSFGCRTVVTFDKKAAKSDLHELVAM